MTVAQILSDAKKRAGLTESDSVLLDWCNQEYQNTNLLIARIAPSYFFKTASLSIVAGTHTYDLPTDFLRSLKIEDENDVEVDQVDPLGIGKPEGWYFAGSNIDAGTRTERIRIQPTPAAAKTNTLSYIAEPVDLDLDTNTVPDWPRGTHEQLILGILMRWMETEEEDERYREYKDLRDSKRMQLFDLITDRHAGNEPGIVVTQPEDYEDD
jgi:hypothetical protein